MNIYKAYNHNGTLIAEANSATDIFKMAKQYHEHTGNAYFIEEEKPMKYRIEIHETQYWSYTYEVEAGNDKEAQELAEQRHFDGEQSDDNWLCESNITGTYIKEIQE